VFLVGSKAKGACNVYRLYNRVCKSVDVYAFVSTQHCSLSMLLLSRSETKSICCDANLQFRISGELRAKTQNVLPSASDVPVCDPGLVTFISERLAKVAVRVVSEVVSMLSCFRLR
jgi:hypothetical protein